MTLHIDVARLREPQRRIELSESPAAFEADDAYRIVAPVELSADVRKSSEDVRLSGTLRTTLELDCGRCLDGYTLPVSTTFDVRYAPADAAPRIDEREVAPEDLDTAYYREGVIDLRELVREQLYLLLPMKPLCRQDCRGLCPVCGTNLNTGACSCSYQWEDPRLVPLKALARKNDDA